MKRLLLPVALLLCSAPGFVHAAEQVATVTVGTWKPAEKGGVDHVKVDGEDIFLNGVRQEVQFRPGMSITIVDGKVVLEPKAEAKPQ